MRHKTTFLKLFSANLLLGVLFFALSGSISYSQEKEYANILRSFNKTTNAENALTETKATYAEMKISGIGAPAYLQVVFPTNSLPGHPVYVNIGKPNINGLDLGGILGLAGDKIKGTLYSGASANSNGSELSGVTTEIYIDEDDFYYLKIVPRAGDIYNSVRITITAAVLVTHELSVYNAFKYKSFPRCGQSTLTGEGIKGGLNILGEFFTNLDYAVHPDPTKYSTISFGAVSLVSSLFQPFYFNGLSQPQDYAKVRLQVGGGSILNVDLLGNFEIRAYSGATLVYTKKLQSGLINGLDLLGLLKNGEIVSVPISPGVPFDRIDVGMNNTLGVSLGSSPLNIYSVERFGGSGSNLTCLDADSPIVDEGGSHMFGSKKVCASVLKSHKYANFPHNAIDGKNGTFTTLEATSGVLLGAGAYGGQLELGYTHVVAAGTTSYMRIDMPDTNLLGSLVNGSVGNLLNGVANTLLFGSHYFSIDVKNTAGTSVLSGASNNGFLNKPIRVVQDKYGHYYVAITPAEAYQSIKITEHYPAVAGLADTTYMKVYSLCYASNIEVCDPATSTFFASNGISLDLLGTGGAGVKNPQSAIDSDDTTRSEINIGTAGVGASVFQSVFFNVLSDKRDYFTVKLALNSGSLVNVDLLANIEIKAYNGSAEVFAQKLSGDVLGLDLLGTLQRGEVVTLAFGPGVPFDRVAIGKSNLLSVNVFSSPLFVYGIERHNPVNCPANLPGEPATTPPFTGPLCATDVTRFDNVNFPFHAVDGNNDTFATLTAATGLAAGIASTDSYIEMTYPDAVPAKTTSYIKIDMEGGILNSLLGGNLGNALGNLVGSVALGNQHFVVDVKRANNSSIYSSDSAALFGSQQVKVVQDKDGRFYIAVTANEPYKSVRITYKLNALLGLGKISKMKVYNMCTESAFDLCEQASFTSFDGSGLSLGINIVDITKGGVQNPKNAIDGNNTSYSTINLGVISAAGSVYQNIYFKTLSEAADVLRLTVKLDQPGLLNLDLIGAYRLKLYRGDQLVYNKTLQSGLINNLDLLSLLNSGTIQELDIKPGVAFDRVQFGLESLVSVNIGAPIHLYSVVRLSGNCQDPTVEVPPYRGPVCAAMLVSSENATNTNKLFDGNHNSYATISSRGGTLGFGGYQGYVELGFGTDGLTVVPKGTTSYIRIDLESTLLQSLLGGSVGDVVGSILGNVVLGNHFFKVEVKNASGQPLVSGSSENSFKDVLDQIRIVQDNKGRFYLAITPKLDYSKIRITDVTQALLVGQSNSINVYGLCYETDFSGCAIPFMTSVDGSGVTVGVAGIGGYGVTNPDRALPNNNNTDYSELSLGTVSIAASIQQNIHFNKEIEENSIFKLKMSVGSGILTADVFGRMELVGYLKNQEVWSKPMQTAFLGNVNLLQLFNNGTASEVRFAVDQKVDRIAVRLKSVVSANVTPNMRLYYLEQDCTAVNAPEVWKSYAVAGGGTTVKGGEEMTYTVHVKNNGTEPLEDYIISDQLPLHTSYVSGGVLTGTAVKFQGIDVAPGATSTVSFVVKVAQDLTDVLNIVNTAVVQATESDPGMSTFPPNANNDGPNVNDGPGTKTPVVPIKDVVSWKSYLIDSNSALSAVQGGETVVYTIHVRNTGNQELTNVLISDVLPAKTTWVSGGNHNQNTVAFTLVNLGVGQTKTVSFTVKVANDLEGVNVITNIASVQADSADPAKDSYPPLDNANPTEPDTTKVPGTPIDVTTVHNIEILKTGLSNGPNPGKAQLNDELTYVISIANTGNKTLNNLRVKDILPSFLTVIDNGGGSETANEIEFALASLAVGQTETFTIKVEVSSLDPGITTVENMAKVFYKDANGSDTYKEYLHKMPTNCFEIVASDVKLTASLLSTCSGDEVTLLAEMPGVVGVINPVYKWYTQANLTGIPQIGESIVVNPQANTTYYVIVEVEGYCFSDSPASIAIEVGDRPATPTLTTNVDPTFCLGGTVVIKSTAVDGNVWFKDGIEIPNLNTQEIEVNEPGIYTAVVKIQNLTCSSEVSNSITVVVHELPILQVVGDQVISTGINVPVQLPQASSSNGATIAWFDTNGVAVTNMQVVFATPGVYNYTVVATLGDCFVSHWIQIYASDLSVCDVPDERIYATRQKNSGSGGIIVNAENAVSGHPYSHSTLTSSGLLGLGLAGQTLEWDETIPAGTPVTIKLGTEYSGLALAGGISVVGTKRNGLGSAIDVGVLQAVDGSLLTLIGGDNSFEYTFVPTFAGKPRDYDGVKILVGSIVSIGQNAKVYGAYYKKASTATVVDCSLDEVRDIYYGTYAPVVNALGATSGVANEWRAVDGDVNTKATMYLGVAVANKTYINVEFRSPFRQNDILKITMSKEVGLNLDLLTGLVIRRYLGDHQVGADISNFNFLNLLGVDPKLQIIVPLLDNYEPFDRVEIFKAGVANVATVIFINEIERLVSPLNIINNVKYIDDKGFVIVEPVCKGGTIELNANSNDNCTQYVWYDVNKNRIGTGTTLTIPSTYAVGEHKVYLQPVRNECENLKPTEIFFTIKKCFNACVTSNPTLTQKIKK